VSVRGEILILLHSHYPEKVPLSDILATMSGRTSSSVKNRLGELRGAKQVYGDAAGGYRLTQEGHKAAVAEIHSAMTRMAA
jgi:DNA-binding IscR family transcriptional regulator